jgi:hypothetical protein
LQNVTVARQNLKRLASNLGPVNNGTATDATLAISMNRIKDELIRTKFCFNLPYPLLLHNPHPVEQPKVDQGAFRTMIKRSKLLDKMRTNIDPLQFADHRPGTTPIAKSTSSKMCLQRVKNCLVLERDMQCLQKKSLDANLSAVQVTKAIDACAENFAARRDAETEQKEDQFRVVRKQFVNATSNSKSTQEWTKVTSKVAGAKSAPFQPANVSTLTYPSNVGRQNQRQAKGYLVIFKTQ